MLWLQIDPDQAQVALDGADLDTGVWLVSLPPGPHALAVSKAGFKPYQSSFDISAGESLHLDVHLEAAPDSGYN